MSDRHTRLVLDDFSGGRNNADTPLGPMFENAQVVDAVNVDWYRTTGARKRWGSTLISTDGATFTSPVAWLGRWVPGIDEQQAELWALDTTAGNTFYRLWPLNAWTAVPATDPPLSAIAGWEVTSAALNGLFFIAYESGVGRLHCYDPATNTLRRTGIEPGGVGPTVSDVAGSGFDVNRYYRIRWIQTTSGGLLQRRSEPTPATLWDPAGANTVRIARPTVPANEGITHWELELSTDGVTFVQWLFYEGSNAPLVAVASYDHNTNPVTDVALRVAQGWVSALTGTHGLQKSYRLIAADQNRLIGWGNWNTTEKQNRLEISAVVGSMDKGDAERVDKTTNWFIDFDELDSGPPRALVGPVWDRFYAFKTRQMFELVPTGSTDQPYRRIKISGELGCVSSHGACRGEDATGSPCLYILTHRGVYRYGMNGFQYIGRGIEDLILGPTSKINMAATKQIGHLVFYPELNQVWVWFATGTSNDPNTLCVFDVGGNKGRGGWSRFTGPTANARCSVMYSDIINPVAFNLVPFMGLAVAPGHIMKLDRTALHDHGTWFQATVTTRPLSVPGFRVATGDIQVLAPSASSVTLTCVAAPDFGASPTVTGTATLTPVGSETRVTVPFSGSALGGSEFVQLVIGDSAPVNNRWSFDRVVVPIHGQEPVTGG